MTALEVDPRLSWVLPWQADGGNCHHRETCYALRNLATSASPRAVASSSHIAACASASWSLTVPKPATAPTDDKIGLATYLGEFAHLRRAADVVRETLREAILDGHLAPGTWLREEEVAGELGVSRTPVREALQQLTAIELVDFKPHQGAVVARLTTDDILAIYVVREALEGVSARLAAIHATPEACEVLSHILDVMDDRAMCSDAAGLAKLNLEFHAQLRHVANNRYLDRYLSQVEHAVRRFGQTTYAYKDRAAASVAEHRDIVDAIAAHDPERAEALAIHHMQQARRLRLTMLTEGM